MTRNKDKSGTPVASDYASFLASPGESPSPALNEETQALVLRELNPGIVRVFTKLMAIHFSVALITLSICPQFGFRILGDGMGLMHYFMNLGTYGCLVACGGFFAGTSVLAAGLLLSREELRALRNHRWAALGAMTSFSLGVFIMLDADFLIGLSLAWLIGAMLASLAALEITFRARVRASA